MTKRNKLAFEGVVIINMALDGWHIYHRIDMAANKQEIPKRGGIGTPAGHSNPLAQFPMVQTGLGTRSRSQTRGRYNLAIKRHPRRHPEESATPWGVGRSFFETYALTVLRRQVANPVKSQTPIMFPKPFFLVAARRAVAISSATALGDLLLRDGDDVDGDGLELDDWLASRSVFVLSGRVHIRQGA